MKLRALGVGTLALGLLTGGFSFSALASSNDENEKGAQSIKADMKILKPGEKKEVPKGLLMKKTKVDEKESVKVSVKTFEPGEMPAIPEGAVMMTTTIVDNGEKDK
jgi:hypothetical protein